MTLDGFAQVAALAALKTLDPSAMSRVKGLHNFGFAFSPYIGSAIGGYMLTRDNVTHILGIPITWPAPTPDPPETVSPSRDQDQTRPETGRCEVCLVTLPDDMLQVLEVGPYADELACIPCYEHQVKIEEWRELSDDNEIPYI